jgi:hypothetical protein
MASFIVFPLEELLFWDMTPYSRLKINRRYGRICHIHLQNRRVSQARNKREADGINSGLLNDLLFHPASYSMGTGGYIPGVKRPGREAGHRGQENMDIYIHSPIRLHGVVLS